MKPENRWLLSLTGSARLCEAREPLVTASDWAQPGGSCLGSLTSCSQTLAGGGSSQRLTVANSIRVGVPRAWSVRGCYRAPGKAPDSYSPGGGAA